MQINIDKKTGTLLGVILVLILAVVFLLAGNSGQSMDHSGHGASSKDESSGEYSADEIMFAQMMIAHHEGALDMVDMINDSTNSEVKTLAANIVKSQSAEIEAMKALLK
jgi:uncharacterized protein (DUF305 family)